MGLNSFKKVMGSYYAGKIIEDGFSAMSKSRYSSEEGRDVKQKQESRYISKEELARIENERLAKEQQKIIKEKVDYYKTKFKEGLTFDKLPTEDKKNKQFMDALVSYYLFNENFYDIPVSLINHFPLEFMKRTPLTMKVLDEKIKTREFYLEALQISPSAYEFISEDWKNDKQFSLDLMKTRPSVFHNLKEEFRCDPKISKTAVEGFYANIFYCPTIDERTLDILHAFMTSNHKQFENNFKDYVLNDIDFNNELLFIATLNYGKKIYEEVKGESYQKYLDAFGKEILDHSCGEIDYSIVYKYLDLTNPEVISSILNHKKRTLFSKVEDYGPEDDIPKDIETNIQDEIKEFSEELIEHSTKKFKTKQAIKKHNKQERSL